MIWSCPHCQNALTLIEDQVQDAWKFVRCLHCGGFSMVRKSPPIPKIAAKRTVIIPATRRAAPKKTPVPPPFRFKKPRAITPPVAQLAKALKDFDAAPPAIQTQKIAVPDPLPELTNRRSRAIVTPLLAATFATLVMVLGVRLHHLSQISRYSQFDTVAKNTASEAGQTEERDLVAPVAEVKASAAVSATGIVDQVRQQAFSAERQVKNQIKKKIQEKNGKR